MLRPWARRVRPDQLPVVDRAVAILVLGNAAAGLASTAAAALFLAHVGARYLGWALAGSSLLVIAALAVVGAAADRIDRARVLAAVAGAGAAAVVAVAVLAIAAPAVAGAIAIVLVKQVQSAFDLVIWVVLAERFDARQGARLVPVWAAAAGVGSALGNLAAVPIAAIGGAAAVLGAGAAIWLAASLIPLGGGGRIARPAPGRGASTEGARAVARFPLARRLALLVAVAGCFASLAYYVLGATAAAAVGGADDLAGFLGAFGGAVQVVTLVVQLVIAPRLLARAGVANALVLAPIAAVAAGLGLVGAGTLVAAAVLQGQARLLDAAIEAPAEKLAQNLLPVAVRGRIAGFLDGAAKRLGAVAGAVMAALLASAPRTLAIATVAIAVVWSVVAFALRRRLPALAVAALTTVPDRDVDADADDPLAAASDAVIAALVAELDGDDAARAAELLARLHARGRTDAIAPLARASAGGRAEVARALADAVEARVPDRAGATRAIAAAIEASRAAAPATREPIVRALGIAAERTARTDGDDASVAAALAAVAGDVTAGALGVAVAVARARVAGDDAAIDEAIEVALDDDDPAAAAAGTRELRAELSRALAGAPDRAIERAHRLVRVARRRRVDAETRAVALAALAAALGRLRGERSASHVLLLSELGALARELADRREPAALAPAPIAAAALRLLAVLPDEPAEDAARLYAAALGDPDDDVRDAAEAGLRALGPAAVGELVLVADFGRRVARDRAAALLGELPVTAAELDRMLDAELALLDATCVHLHVLAPTGGLLARRLDERAREIAHTVLLLVAARHRSRPVAAAARVFRCAPDTATRARALAVLETALPRAMVARLLDAVDDLPAAERSRAAAARQGTAPDRDRAVTAELGGGDRLARALVLHTLDADARAHRATISSAAASAAAVASPLALLRRIADADDDGDRDVPTRVETMLILGDVPLLSQLTARQLADLAGAADWRSARADDVVAPAGEALDALIVVADGELSLGDDRAFARGHAVDELAWFAPAPLAAPLVATRATRYLRIERLDFDELVDDVPGLGAAVLRVLGTRARR